MTTKELNQLFQRDLDKLGTELAAYTDEHSIWVVAEGIANSGGNLAMHLFGNLRTFIGLDLGGIPYTRDREREFAAKGVPRSTLLEELAEVKKVISTTLLEIDQARLGEISERNFFGYEMTIGYFLVHLFGHFSYHLGQINYHRRLLGGES